MYYSIVVEMVEGAMQSLATDYFISRNIVPREQILALYFALGDLLSAGTILALHMDGWMVRPGTTRLSSEGEMKVVRWSDNWQVFGILWSVLCTEYSIIGWNLARIVPQYRP